MQNNKHVLDGVVVEAFKGGLFKVKLDEPHAGWPDEVSAYLAGKMRLHYIKVLVGDRVSVRFSEYDKERGRIIKRL